VLPIDEKFFSETSVLLDREVSIQLQHDGVYVLFAFEQKVTQKDTIGSHDCLGQSPANVRSNST
jgi:hypothetical protein